VLPFKVSATRPTEFSIRLANPNKTKFLFVLSAAPRFEIPETYVDGLIFRHEEIIRLKIPMVAKPTPKVTS
jgi:hypothetical protein